MQNTERSKPGEAQPSPGFQRKMQEAFPKAITDSANAGLLQRFKAAYEHRGQFRFLGESGHMGSRKINGLTYAIDQALGSYVSGPDRQTTTSTSSVNETSENPQPIELSVWQQQLLAEGSTVIKNNGTIYRFESGIFYTRIDTSELTVEELSGHITRALDRYYIRRQSGTSPDPW